LLIVTQTTGEAYQHHRHQQEVEERKPSNSFPTHWNTRLPPPLIHQYFSPTLVFSSAVKRTIQMCFQDQLELATGNRDHHLSADYVPLHVGIGFIFKPVERYWLTGSCDAGRCL
jgi:hypothetical protein